MKARIPRKHTNVQIKDLRRLYYTRYKTSKDYSVLIYPEAWTILDYLRGDKYLLNIADDRLDNTKERSTPIYKDVLSQHNDYLRRIMLDILNKKDRISTYTARYCWATYASKIGIPKDTISYALGHGNKSITDGYIDYDLNKVDEANRLVIDYVLETLV